MNDLLATSKGSQDAMKARKRPNPGALKPRPTHAVPAKKPNNHSTSTPFDSIMNEIEAFDYSNKRKQKDKRGREQRSTDEGDNNKEGPSSSKMMSSNLPPTPVPSSYLALTRAEVARSDEDSSMVRKFLKKEGLMERILGYKMMRGRVEPYNIMKLVVNLDDCVSPVYEENAESINLPHELRNKSLPLPSISRVLQICPSTPPQKPSEASPSLNQPTSLVTRRGPQTPPGSPGPAMNNNSSNSSTAHPENGQEEYKSIQKECTSLPPPPVFPNLSDTKEENSDRSALLQQMATLTNTSIAQLEDFMGEDLQNAIDKMDKSVLLSTLKNALRDVTGQTPKKPNGQEVQKLLESSSLGGCENMDISSEQSDQEGRKAPSSYAFDSPLLPPPPMAPKPLSPPPPPPPMSISPTLPQFVQPIPPPPFMFATPPPMVATSYAGPTQPLQPSNLQYSTPPKEQIKRGTQKPPVIAGPIHPQRAPTVNLDFIKSRPPPPIPDILKQHGMGSIPQTGTGNPDSMANAGGVVVTNSFNAPLPPFPPLVPCVPAKQGAMPVFGSHLTQPPPTIQQPQHNTHTPVVHVNQEKQLYSGKSAAQQVVNNSSVNFGASPTTTIHIQPKLMQQNLLFPTPPPPFPAAPNFIMHPPPPTSQVIQTQAHQPSTNLYQMPPPNLTNNKDRQQHSYNMDNSNNTRTTPSNQPPVQDFSTPPPDFSKLPPPPIPFVTPTFDAGTRISKTSGPSRPPPNEPVGHVPVTPASIKMELKVETIEEESPIKAIHHHNQMFKTLMSALGTSSKADTSSNNSSGPEVQRNSKPQSSAIPSLMSSNYSPPPPLVSLSKKPRSNGNRREKNRRQQLPRNRRKEAKKEAKQAPNIWDSIEM